MTVKKETPHESLFVSGHRACHGCGMALGVRHILEATGNDVIVVSPTGCLETFTSPYGFSPWRQPGQRTRHLATEHLVWRTP